MYDQAYEKGKKLGYLMGYKEGLSQGTSEEVTALKEIIAAYEYKTKQVIVKYTSDNPCAATKINGHMVQEMLDLRNKINKVDT